MNPLQNYLSTLSTKKAAPLQAGAGSKSVQGLFAKPQPAQQPASQPLTPAVSQSPSATTTAPAPEIRPAQQPSPKEQYIGSLAGQNAPQLEQKYKPQPEAQKTAETPAAGAGAKDSFLQAYRDYLSQYSASVKPSSEVRDASTRLADIQSKIEERKVKADQTYQRKLDQPGMLKGGAASDAAQFARRENADLANLAVQESAAARSLSALTGARESDVSAAKTLADINKPLQIGDRYYDPATGQEIGAGKDTGFTLSPGEVRYDASGKVVATGGPKPQTAAQEAAQIKQQEADKQAEQQATQTLGIINNLLNTGRYKAISGAAQTGSVPFLGDRAAVNEYDQLQGLLKLGIRGLIKGQGAVSDYEGKVLGQASSALSRLTGEGQMKQALQTVRGVIRTNNGQVTSVTVTNPETGESVTDSLSGSEIYQLVSEGNTVTYN